MSYINQQTFVSRGGVKLQSAIENFKVEVSGRDVLDVGSSTGGFVDCLLQNGAAKVYAVDTAYGELAWKLRNDSRVVVMERTNILHLKTLYSPVIAGSDAVKQSGLKNDDNSPSSFEGEVVKVDLITIDAGWTKLGLVLPVVRQFLKKDGKIIALLKPQYEVDKKFFKGGALPEDLSEQVRDQTIVNVKNLGFDVEKCIDSPILGGDGNREYLLLIKDIG